MIMAIKRNVMYTQAKGCWFCLHVGDIAIYVGRALHGRRLEFLTSFHRFRWSHTEC